MVKRSEIGEFVTAWLQGHGLSVGSEVLGRLSRVRSPAPSLQMRAVEPLVASYGATKTATLTTLRRVDVGMELRQVGELRGRERRRELAPDLRGARE